MVEWRQDGLRRRGRLNRVITAGSKAVALIDVTEDEVEPGLWKERRATVARVPAAETWRVT